MGEELLPKAVNESNHNGKEEGVLKVILIT